MNRAKRYAGVFVLLALMCAASCALAVQISVRRADGVGSSVNMWERSSNKKYLFLPAYMHGQALEITYSGTRSVSLGDIRLESGIVTDQIASGARLTISKDSSRVSVLESANLPAVHITTESGSLTRIHKRKGNREAGHLQIVTAQGEVVCDAPLEYIKGHGNATFIYEKKPYQIKLEKKASFLGMNEGKSYVLLANQHENSLLRNRITFDLARALGLTYTPECVSVDLYINGEYRGNYLLCDKVTISSGSVDITDGEDAIEFANEAFLERGGKPESYGKAEYESGRFKGKLWPREPEDVTGGYLFELEYRERYADETSGLCTEKGQSVVVKEPEEMSMAQGRYAYELLGSFERAIFAADGVDGETGRHYTEIADFDSLVRKYMIEEICKNYDGNKSSQYFYKDVDAVNPLLYAGPVWDYDSAWGNYAREGHMESAEPDGLSIARQGYDYSWWPALYRQQDFRAEVRLVYEGELRPMLEALIGDGQEEGICTLDQYAGELAASAEMNFLRWRIFNHDTRAVKTGADYPQNIEYLRRWIRARMAYLDTAW
ncbi:MAG: CotH kinase family protein [Clostridia bacterium]|nr:CotH kinase family protein [Clostridia bacterium]